MAISLGAIYWFLTREGKSKIVGAAFFAAVAPLAKQSLLGAPVGIFLALLWKRKLKQAAIFASIVGIVGFGTLSILTILTDGRAWLHLVEYNSNELQISRMVEMTYFFITRHTATLVLGSLAALFYFDEMPRVAVTYTIATGVSVVLTAKVGSDVLYYYPFLSAMSILAGIYLGHTFPNGLLESINQPIDCERFREPLIALLLVATLLLTGISPPNDNAHGSVEAAEFLDSVDGDVLAEDAGVLISSDRPVHYQPYIFNRLHKQGVWNETPFVTSIQQKKYDYVVLTGSANSSSGWFTPRQRRAVNDNYKLHKRFEDYYVYIPATEVKSPLSVT